MFFYRDPEEAKEHKEEQQPVNAAVEYTQADTTAPGAHELGADTNWAADATVPVESTWTADAG